VTRSNMASHELNELNGRVLSSDVAAGHRPALRSWVERFARLGLQGLQIFSVLPRKILTARA
jgi:hypothetical protein